MKKNVLFVLPSFGVGGTTVSVRNLISVLDKEKYDITVWALNDKGILEWMYEGVRKVKTNIVAQALALTGYKYEHNKFRRLIVALVRMLSRNRKIKEMFVKYSIRHCLKNNNYDTVVSCQEGFTTYFVSKIESDNYVAWVRCDYKEHFKANNYLKESFYKKYNHIVCVAEKTRDNFIEIYPEYSNKTICIYNPQDTKLIVSQADINDNDKRFDYNNGKFVIVSVGRLSRVKRFDRIPSIAKKLLQYGLDFTWYIIGDGESRNAIVKEIKENNIDSNVIMLGAKSNPHFYIKRADLYVCLSSSEACPRVVNEAKILSTPVVSTDFPTIYEYIEDGINGRITSIDNTHNVIKEILTDKEQYSNIKEKISEFTFDNTNLVRLLDSVL